MRSVRLLGDGFRNSDNGFAAQSTPSQNVIVGGNSYTPAQVGTLRGSVAFDGSVPFLGLGWDWSRSKRVGLSLDLGLLKQGSPRVALSADGSLLGDTVFEADLAAEALELENALEDLSLFPLATLGVVFRF